MANTYYDSQLTAVEIEDVLEAIKDIIIPANNGKVLAINNGKLEARSVQWGGGGGAVVQPLSVTQNGTYNPPSGVDGYAPVTVNVSGGGGGDGFINKAVHYLNSNNIHSEFETIQQKSVADVFSIVTDNANIGGAYYSSSNDLFYYNQSQKQDVTVYAILKIPAHSGDQVLVGDIQQQNNYYAPSIFSRSGSIYCSVWANDTNTGVSAYDFHVLTLKLDYTSKKAYYFIDGIQYGGEKSFIDMGDYVCIGGEIMPNKTFVATGGVYVVYGAWVDEAESSATIIANHQALMQIYSDYIGT